MHISLAIKALCCAFTGILLGALPLQAAQTDAEPTQDSAAQTSLETVPEDLPEIVITGERLDRPSIVRFIDAVLWEESSGQTGQYARFDRSICPSAIGFNDEVRSFIENRIRAIATTAGISVDRSGCRPNLHLVLVDDGNSAVELLRQQHRRIFSGMKRHQQVTLERGDGPVFNWHLISQYGHDGEKLGDASASVGGPDAADSLNIVITDRNTRLQLPTYFAISHGFVMIERDAVVGFSPVQLADFAAMRGLLQARRNTARAQAADSILGLFEEDGPPDERTQSVSPIDIALLASLYQVANDVNANRQRGRTATSVQTLMAGGDLGGE